MEPPLEEVKEARNCTPQDSSGGEDDWISIDKEEIL